MADNLLAKSSYLFSLGFGFLSIGALVLALDESKTYSIIGLIALVRAHRIASIFFLVGGWFYWRAYDFLPPDYFQELFMSNNMKWFAFLVLIIVIILLI